MTEVSELTGHALDWAAAKAEAVVYHGPAWTKYSTDWSQAGPLIEREKIDVNHYNLGNDRYPAGMWVATRSDGWERHFEMVGRTALEAAMKTFVAIKLGFQIEVPSEILKEAGL